MCLQVAKEAGGGEASAYSRLSAIENDSERWRLGIGVRGRGTSMYERQEGGRSGCCQSDSEVVGELRRGRCGC